MATLDVNITATIAAIVDGGTEISGLSITKVESAYNYAPHGVSFEADYSACSFDTTHPASATVYDERFHDLDIYWTFDDVGTFDKLDRVPTSWKDRNWALHGNVTHVFTAAGSYTVTCVVYEKSSNKYSQATTTVTVADPASEFPTTQTICIYPTGGSAGTVPTGAQTVEASQLRDGDTIWENNKTGVRRWLFQAGTGHEYTLGVTISDGEHLFGSYGTGDTPVLKPTDDQTGPGSANRCVRGLGWNSLKIQGLSFAGNYDPKLGDRSDLDPTTISLNCVTSLNTGESVFDDCSMSGFGAPSIIIQAGVSNERVVYINNCLIEDFGGQYPVFFSDSTNTGSIAGVTGTAFIQKEDAVSGTGNFRAPIRDEGTHRAHYRCLEIFHRDHSQEGIKFLNSIPADGDWRVTGHSISVEAGLKALSVGGNLSTSRSVNARFSDIIVIGGMRTQTGIMTSSVSGVTIENAFLHLPAIDYYINELFRIFTFNFDGISEAAAASPINIRNCTAVCTRSLAQNNSTTPPFQLALNNSGPNVVTINESNNILHLPNMSAASTHVPLDDSTVLFQSRNTYGYIPTYGTETGTLGSNVADAGIYDVTVADSSIYSDFAGDLKECVINGTARTGTYSIINGTTIRVTNTSGVQWNIDETFSFGFVWGAGVTHSVDTATATPTDAIKTWKPESGSTALGGATGTIPRRSLGTTDVRPSGSENIGAWQ